MCQKQPKNKNYLKPMFWYIVEVSFSRGNPIHRCIAFHREKGCVELIGSYDLDDMPCRKHISELAYFNVIKPLPEMEGEPEAFLPKDAPLVIFVEVQTS